MAVTFSTVVIDSIDQRALSEFWCGVLGWKVIGTEDDASIEIGPQDGSTFTWLFEPVTERKSVKNRVHIDVNPVGADQADELERLVALGARRVDIGQGDQTWVVLADPEGNEFCLLRTRKG